MASQGEVLHSNDSKSLWNSTLSPGWTEREVEVFRIALMKFGLGRWTKIVESRCLPGKTVAQLNNQAQRMIGQQSTSEFTGLHVDPTKVFEANQAKSGVRKNGCLINTDKNPTQEEIRRKRRENQLKFGLSQSEIDRLVIPVLKQEEISTVVIKSAFTLKDTANRRREQYDKVRELQSHIQKIQQALSLIQSGHQDNQLEPQTQPSNHKNKGKGDKRDKRGSGKRQQSKVKAKRSRPAKTRTADEDLARRLQMEEDGLGEYFEASQDCEDFEEEYFVSSRGRRCRKKKPRNC